MNVQAILSFFAFTLMAAFITWWKLRKADTSSQQGNFLAQPQREEEPFLMVVS